MTSPRFTLAPCALGIALSAPALAAPACDPLPGAAALAAPGGPDFIILGEAHGTRELPEAFSGIVCALSAAGAPLTVGLEFLPEDQPAIDAYLASDGSAPARAALLASPGWSDRHGRASEAIFGVVEMLRTLKAGGADIAAVAFDHPSEQPGTSAAREKGMADLLIAARNARPDAKIVALTGIGHAGKSEWTSLGPPFPSMSQQLPQGGTIALAFVRGGGEFWACRAPAEGAAEECRAWPGTLREPIPARGLVLSGDRANFDGVVSVGRPFSASPPARDER